MFATGDPDGIRTHETSDLKTDFEVNVDLPPSTSHTRSGDRVSAFRKIDDELLRALRKRPK